MAASNRKKGFSPRITEHTVRITSFSLSCVLKKRWKAGVPLERELLMTLRHHLLDDMQILQGQGMARVQLKGSFEMRFSFLQLAQLRQGASQICLRIRVLWLQVNCIAKLLGGPAEIAL